MRIIHLFSLSVVLLLSACSSQDHYRFYEGSARTSEQLVSILVPEALDVLSINGKKMDNRLGNFKRGDTTIDLLPGNNKIEMRYSQIWDIDADNHEKVASPEVYIDANLAAGKYKLQYPKIDNILEARRFVKNAQINLINTADNKVVSHTTYTNPAETLSLTAVSNKNAPSTTVTAPIVPAAPVINTGEKRNQTAKDITLDNLKYWWEQSSEEQKAQFILWTQQQK